MGYSSLVSIGPTQIKENLSVVFRRGQFYYLFFIFINDLHKVVEFSRVHHFVDYTNMLLIEKIDQLYTPYFPIGLVKTKSGFIVRSAGLGRLTLVVAVIGVVAYPFLACSNLTCHPEDMGTGIFWLHCAAW